MKKIAMFTMGTRGDVQPYIYLSQGHMLSVRNAKCMLQISTGSASIT